MEKPANRNSSHEPFDLELDDLLHPARAFAHPCDVVNDPDLSLNEKRAILASWASDGLFSRSGTSTARQANLWDRSRDVLVAASGAAALN